ncbi:MAG: helix-turn-helix domain-containing protein [Halioglobus sp.]
MRKDTQATRKRIIDAAESLFADKGVEATSLLDIARAAEQKNRSALQYHFKNKEGLLHAVLDKHAIPITESRNAYLDQLEAAGNYSLYQLVKALVAPMAAQLDNSDGGSAFIKIHSELMSSEQFRGFRQQRDKDLADVQRMHHMARPFIDMSDPDALRARGILVGCLLIHGLTTYLPQQTLLPREVFLHTLIQGIVDLMQQQSAGR